ncbi:hypothetical protein PISL3812_03700 [Talaromyces islandicus]|uniref:Oxidase ustYa n=1 Tax=Talaromyces islandicus TaxID=28573 RepID=A0A0U1LVT8_TALIS|nr:hypothetical protein PISL3812_03700 [Talaromyces islandicus]
MSVVVNQDEEQQAFIPKAQEDMILSENDTAEAKLICNGYSRLILEIFMGIAIVFLSIGHIYDKEAIKSSLVPNLGRGYVQINKTGPIDLGEPYTIDVHSRTEPVYMMSVFHQLHCLKSYLVQAYQAAFTGSPLTKELAHHSSHCFDYLRQSVLCAADTTLEGKTTTGPGWGSVHECKDYDALLAWANEHSVMAWKANTVDTAIL